MADVVLIGGVARSGNETAEQANWRALRTAWQPIAAGFKAIWWKAVALPEDVFDEDDFRASESTYGLPSCTSMYGYIFVVPMPSALQGSWTCDFGRSVWSS